MNKDKAHAKYHGTGAKAMEAAAYRARQIHGVAYELNLSGPWDGYWSGPEFPYTATLDDYVLDAREPLKTR
jgi:hypothetical protein